MKFKKPNPREMIVIGISILLLYQFTIRLIFEKSSTQELILQFSFFTIGCILAVLLREFFTLLHEFGHVISLHLISFFNKCIIINYRVKCTITKESTYPLRYKTTSNIDDYLRNNLPHTKLMIRLYALGGVLFVFTLLITLYVFIPNTCTFGFIFIIDYLELMPLCNDRPTNDLNVFINPYNF